MSNQAFETVSVEFTMMGSSGSEQVFNTSVRHNVTPPEYILLEEIHGRHNVAVIEQTEIARETAGFERKGSKTVQRFRPRTHDEEVDRLRGWYGAKLFQSVYAEKYPKLPYTFEEARIPTSNPDNVTEISTGTSQEEQVNTLTNALPKSGEAKPPSKKPAAKTPPANKKEATGTAKGG